MDAELDESRAYGQSFQCVKSKIERKLRWKHAGLHSGARESNPLKRFCCDLNRLFS